MAQWPNTPMPSNSPWNPAPVQGQGSPASHAPPPRQGMPVWAKFAIGCGGITLLFLVLICAGLIYVGVNSPDSQAVPGHQMRKRDLQTIQVLGLIDADETIGHFYSDGFFDIKEGLYFYTDRKVVLYNKDAAQPLIIVPFEQIKSIDVEYSDSFFVDSTIWLETEDDFIALPVCKEAGGDRKFYEGLTANWKRSHSAADAKP